GAHHVCPVIAVVAAPGTGFRGVVQNRIHAGAGGDDRIAVGKIAAHLADAERIKLRVVAAVEARDLVSAFDQATAQRLAKESAAARHQYPHFSAPSRQSGVTTASYTL